MQHIRYEAGDKRIITQILTPKVCKVCVVLLPRVISICLVLLPQRLVVASNTTFSMAAFSLR